MPLAQLLGSEDEVLLLNSLTNLAKQHIALLQARTLPNVSPALFACHVDLSAGGGGFSFWKLRSEEGCLCCIVALLNVSINCTTAHKSQECPLALWLVEAEGGLVFMENSCAWTFQW